MSTEAAKVIVQITDQSAYIERASTSIVGSVITATKGPVNELTEITSRQQLVQVFGSVTADHIGMVAADTFFDLCNGRLFLVRVGVTDEAVTGHFAKATTTIVDQTDPTPVNTVTFTMKEFGTYGNRYSINVSEVKAGEATIKVYDGTTLKETKVVSLDAADANFIETEFADSDYCTCEVLIVDASAVLLATGDSDFAGGSDGIPGEADYAELVAAYVGEYDETNDVYTGAELLTQRQDSINVLATFGFTEKAFIVKLGLIAQGRLDCFVAVDASLGSEKKGLVPADVVAWADGTGTFTTGIAGWHYAIFWDWQKRTLSDGTVVNAPPTGYLTAKISYNDDIYGFWLPVAGLSRGVLGSEGCLRTPTMGQADSLVKAQINPIIDMGRQGIVVWGNETRNTASTDLSALHVVRALLYCIDSIKRSSKGLMFELNNSSTWNKWKNSVGNFLEGMVARGALHSYSIAMGNETMTQDDIQNRIMRGEVGLRFFMDGEVIYLDFQVQASGL